jgi:hypothetical protein
VDGLGAGGAITLAAVVQLAGVAVGFLLMRLPALRVEAVGRSMGT